MTTCKYTLGDVVLSVDFSYANQLNSGNKVKVTPIYGEQRGRMCSKIVHGEVANPYIWWNAEKVYLKDYDVLSAEETIERFKKGSLDFDDLMSVIQRNDKVAFLQGGKDARIIQIYTRREFYDELDSDFPTTLSIILQRNLGYRPMKREVDRKLLVAPWPSRKMGFGVMNKNMCPVILEKPLRDYHGNYMYVDKDYRLKESKHFPLKYFFSLHPKGWGDAGVIYHPRHTKAVLPF